MDSPDQASGYLADITYPDRFYRELSPVWLNYVAAVSGAASPRPTDQAFTYLDLGCGFARSTIVNAAAFPAGQFHACDFNAAHIEAADRYRAQLGLGNVTLHQTYFEELLARDLPPFDFIVLHGVYSWVGPEVRRVVQRLIAEKLKDGGLVYVSYNCQPGWSSEAPLRKLMLELGASRPGGVGDRARAAADALRGLASGSFKYFRDNPAAVTAVEAMAEDPADYLAHEFLNETWALHYSVDVADDMAAAGLRFVGSATLPYNHPVLFLDKQSAETVARLPTPRLQQLAADFAINQRFRRDVFVGGSAPAPTPQQALATLEQVVIGCLDDPEQIPVQATIPRGKISFKDDLINELRAIMRSGARNIRETVVALGGEGRNSSEIGQNLVFLTAAGVLAPFAKGETPGAPSAPLRALNQAVARSLALISETGIPAVVPCEQAGNGVMVRLAEARAAMESLNGAAASEPALRRLIRLGLLA